MKILMVMMMMMMAGFARLVKSTFCRLLHLIKHMSNYFLYYLSLKYIETEFQKVKLSFPQITS